VQVDPASFAGGDVNLYRTVANSPITYVDPAGLLISNATPGGLLATAWAFAVIYGLRLVTMIVSFIPPLLMFEAYTGFFRTTAGAIYDNAVNPLMQRLQRSVSNGSGPEHAAGDNAARNVEEARPPDQPPPEKPPPEPAAEGAMKGPNKPPRSFRDQIRDAEANPDKWKVVKRESVPSTNMRNKGGTSVQVLLRNEETGEEIVRHTIYKPDGSIYEPSHFRPNWN
jgi:hypothetical protein